MIQLLMAIFFYLHFVEASNQCGSDSQLKTEWDDASRMDGRFLRHDGDGRAP